jgi:2-polyprenyl-3-methyl-5-hydroxy-6-metoxy-1,4-benzoquinol methylase
VADAAGLFLTPVCMNYKSRYYPENRFGGFTEVDGTIAFYTRINALISPEAVVVDVGCGRGAFMEDRVTYRRNLRLLKGKCQLVIGLDVDKAGASNPGVDEFRLIDHPTWPVASASVDVCVCDYVLEHVTQPAEFIAECWRLLKPGGFLCIRTSNLLSYFGLLAKLSPARMQSILLRKGKNQMRAQDTFKTFYRANTLFRLRRLLARQGFEGVVFGSEAEPGYLSFSRFFYWLGVLHQRHAPRVFKVGLLAFVQKPVEIL